MAIDVGWRFALMSYPLTCHYGAVFGFVIPKQFSEAPSGIMVSVWLSPTTSGNNLLKHRRADNTMHLHTAATDELR